MISIPSIFNAWNIIVFLFIRRRETSILSSRLGVGTDISLLHKDILHREMDILGDLMRSLAMFPRKQSAWMILSSGLIILRRAISRHVTDKKYMETMVSLSTLISLYFPKIMWNLIALKSRLIVFNLTKNTLVPSWISQCQKIITDMQSQFGLVNQVSYTFSMTNWIFL